MKLLFIMLGLTGFVNSFSQSQVEPLNLPPENSNQTLLWEISGNNLKQPSYFLGTMHILCPQDAYLSASVKKILDRVDAIYLEIDMDDMMAMMGALKAMNMMKDTTLEDLLSEEELLKVKSFFSNQGTPFPFGMLQKFKPMLLSSMVAESKMPCESGSGTESLLMVEAKKRHLPIEGLETAAYQAGLFDSIPYKDQALELVKTIDSIDVQDQTMDQMILAYRSQNLTQIESLTLSEEGGVSKYMDLLLYNRNRNWADKFEEIAAKGPKLFAVGAGHLPGDQGVLELLRKKGFTVKPILNEMKPVGIEM